MRRHDREITDFDEIIAVMRKCDVCRLAFFDEKYPYILPLNFGMQVTDTKVTLFFHGASEGRKYELMKKNPNASFEMDCGHELQLTEREDGCHCTMKYESVIGHGTLSILHDAQKKEALDFLMEQYHGTERSFCYNEKVMAATTVFKLDVDSMSGKRR